MLNKQGRKLHFSSLKIPHIIIHGGINDQYNLYNDTTVSSGPFIIKYEYLNISHSQSTIQKSLQLEGFELALLEKISTGVLGYMFNVKLLLLSYPYVASLPQVSAAMESKEHAFYSLLLVYNLYISGSCMTLSRWMRE